MDILRPVPAVAPAASTSAALPAIQPLLHGAVAFELSLGTLVFHLYGIDCPNAAANLVALCHQRYYNGATIGRVVKDNYFELRNDNFASHTVAYSAAGLAAEAALQRSGAAASGPLVAAAKAAGGAERLRFAEETALFSDGPRLPAPAVGSAASAAAAARKPPAFAGAAHAPRIDRPGLLLLVGDRTRAGDDPSAAAPRSLSSRLLVTLSTRRLRHLETCGRCVLVGEVAGIGATLAEQRASAPLRLLRHINAAVLRPFPGVASDGSSECTDGRPLRVVRVHRTAVVDDPFFAAATAPASAAAATSALLFHPSLRVGLHALYRRFGAPTPPLVFPSSSSSSSAGGEDRSEDRDDAPTSPAYNHAAVPDGCLSSEDDDDVADAASRRAGGGAGDGSGGIGGPLRDLAGADAATQRLRARAQGARVDRTRELMLQVLADLPSGADESAALDGSGGVAAPLQAPENVLFVCRLSPFTTSEDLALCFRQFGRVVECEVVRDRKTGASLQYAFVEFEAVAACERAYAKMENVLIDECRIHVDFCQSVSKVWQAQRKRQPPHQQVGDKRPRDAS